MPYFFHAIFIIDGNDGNLTFSPTKIRNRQTIFIILPSIINCINMSSCSNLKGKTTTLQFTRKFIQNTKARGSVLWPFQGARGLIKKSNKNFIHTINVVKHEAYITQKHFLLLFSPLFPLEA